MTFDNMHECMVDILICNGVEVDPQQYNGDISQCIIRKVRQCFVAAAVIVVVVIVCCLVYVIKWYAAVAGF